MRAAIAARTFSDFHAAIGEGWGRGDIAAR
jgi:hypothetical protein